MYYWILGYIIFLTNQLAALAIACVFCSKEIEKGLKPYFHILFISDLCIKWLLQMYLN